MRVPAAAAALALMVNGAAQADSRLKQFADEMVDLCHREIRAQTELVLGRELLNEEAYDTTVDEIEAITSEEVCWILAVERGWPRGRYERYILGMCLPRSSAHLSPTTASPPSQLEPDGSQEPTRRIHARAFARSSKMAKP